MLSKVYINSVTTHDHEACFTDTINSSSLSVCRYCVLLQQKDKWEEQEGRGRKEKEELNQEIQRNRLLQQENLQLKTEVDRYCIFTHGHTVGH